MTAGEVLLLLMFIATAGICCGISFAAKNMPMAGIALLLIVLVIAFVYFVVLHAGVAIRIG